MKIHWMALLGLIGFTAMAAGCSGLTDGTSGDSSGSGVYADTRSEVESGLIGYWLCELDGEKSAFHFDDSVATSYWQSYDDPNLLEQTGTGPYEVKDGLSGETRPEIWALTFHMNPDHPEYTDSHLFRLETGRELLFLPSDSDPVPCEPTTPADLDSRGLTLE